MVDARVPGSGDGTRDHAGPIGRRGKEGGEGVGGDGDGSKGFGNAANTNTEEIVGKS